MSSRSSQDGERTIDSPGGGSDERERIRGQMKMVIGQLEGILQELKEVAKELREVVGQIDQLTSDFEFDMDPDDWTTATVSSTSSSEKGGFLFDLSHLDFMSSDILSDSWEFCSFLEASTPSDSGDGSGEQPGRPPDYRLMNGGLIPNGPGVETPDSSSEETFSSVPNHRPSQRTPGTRERVRFSDKVLYHALCCDDDDEGDPDRDGNAEQVVEAPLGCWDKQSVVSSPGNPIATSKVLRPASKQIHVTGGVPYAGTGQRKVTKNSSTQTVLDKSTQTVLPYVSDKQKAKGKN
ncbi:inhibitory synaptic factor 1 [Ambystoma mexicanum]|uniref:inhibitory synaptic factor 1 n=1 Tax=Ambystoma mexicanum TaxID=8296 RepID=UPI0037E97FAE